MEPQVVLWPRSQGTLLQVEVLTDWVTGEPSEIHFNIKETTIVLRSKQVHRRGDVWVGVESSTLHQSHSRSLAPEGTIGNNQIPIRALDLPPPSPSGATCTLVRPLIGLLLWFRVTPPLAWALESPERLDGRMLWIPGGRTPESQPDPCSEKSNCIKHKIWRIDYGHPFGPPYCLNFSTLT